MNIVSIPKLPETNLEKIVRNYKLVLDNAADDSAFLLFCLSVLEFNESLLSDTGIRMLTSYDIGMLLKELKPEKQDVLIKVSLYFTICFVVTQLFVGLCEHVNRVTVDEAIDEFLSKTLQQRALKVLRDYNTIIQSIQKQFTEESCLKYGELRHALFEQKIFASTTYKLPDLIPPCESEAEEKAIRDQLFYGREAKSKKTYDA
jgi:hypothetical protein